MTRTARIEGRVQIAIMLFMGGVAGAASFKHVHDLAVTYGQPSLIGWADAVVVELMSIVAGLEIRRRKRTGQSAAFVYLVFFGAVLISLAAQVAKAHPSPWGWIMAALPALGFLAVVKIVLTRQPIETGPDRTVPDTPGPVHIPDLYAPTPAESSPPRTGLDRSTTSTGSDLGNTSGQSNALAGRVHDDVAGEASDPTPAEQTEAGIIGEANSTGCQQLDRTATGSLVPAQRINGQKWVGPETDPTTYETPLPRADKTGSRPVRDRSVVDVSGPVRDRSAAGMSGPVRDRTAAADMFRQPRTHRDRSASVVSGPDYVEPDLNLSEPDRTGLDDELLELGLTIATRVRMRKDALTREVLIDEIRREGRTIGTDRASRLLNWIKWKSKMAEAVPVGAD